MDQQRNPLFEGDRITPTRTRYTNSMSIQTISSIARSSFGPKGLDKMLVDESGAITVTNDGATIFKLLDIADPAARLLATLSRSQDSAAGDGTTSVAIISGELIKLGIEKIMEGLHPSIVSSGLIKACSEASKFIREKLSITQEQFDNTPNRSLSGMMSMMSAAISTSLNSKIVNVNIAHFAPMVAEAVAHSPFDTEDGAGGVQVLLRLGQSVENSRLLNGYAIPAVPLNEELFRAGPVRGRVVLVSADFQPRRFGLGVKINLDDPATIDLVKRKENELPLKALERLRAEGVVGLISSSGFSAEAARKIEGGGMFALKRLGFGHMKRLSDMLGARVFASLDSILEADFSEKETSAGVEVEQELVDEGSVLLIRGAESKGASSSCRSILVRGANEYVLEEVERSVHDALCVGFKLKAKGELKGASVVAGGGSAEVAAGVYLEQLAETYSSKIRIPIRIFAHALFSVPETLAANAGLNVADVMSRLKRDYKEELTRDNVEEDDIRFKYKGVGTDSKNPVIDDMVAIGVVEPLMSKLKILDLATEAALSVLRVDESIKLYPKEEKPDKNH